MTNYDLNENNQLNKIVGFEDWGHKRTSLIANHVLVMLAILLRAGICGGTAMRSPSKRFPRYNCFEGIWLKKMRFSLLSKFYLNRPQMRTCFTVDKRIGKDLNSAVAR